ncbi:MAG: helix-hairpin-helix domain-containing protein [Bacteroidia bacterium]|nr:helix-hairpin-helix domain-containing protein [Bacteroidia bacterium]
MKDLFRIPQSQRRPALIFGVILMMLLLVRWSLDYFIKPSREIAVYEEIEDGISLDSLVNRKEESKHDSLFFFDPNTVTKENLIKLGVSEKTAGTWIKFREKGFVFRKAEDIEKVYGLRKERIKKLLPYVRISKTENPGKYQKESPHQGSQAVLSSDKITATKTKLLDINTADSSDLEELPMIGPVLARRIIKYREMLGGYIKVEQLREVYGMKDENFDAIKNRIYVDKNYSPRKLNLMTDDFKTINRHPYMTYDITKKIMYFRKQSKINKENVCLVMDNDTVCNRMLPYLQLE